MFTTVYSFILSLPHFVQIEVIPYVTHITEDYMNEDEEPFRRNEIMIISENPIIYWGFYFRLCVNCISDYAIVSVEFIIRPWIVFFTYETRSFGFCLLRFPHFPST